MAFDHRIDIGAKPPTKAETWKFLSQEAKDLLYQQRLQGRFGGMPGKAPYWRIQEVGEPKAAVEPLFYLQRAVERWQTKSNAIVDGWVRGL